MDTMGQMVLANWLTDGRVVFLAADGSWVDDIAAGAFSTEPGTAERLLAVALDAEARNLVVEPYLIGVRDAAGQRRPVDWREAIRASGPTIRTDLPG